MGFDGRINRFGSYRPVLLTFAKEVSNAKVTQKRKGIYAD